MVLQVETAPGSHLPTAQEHDVVSCLKPESAASEGERRAASAAARLRCRLLLSENRPFPGRPRSRLLHRPDDDLAGLHVDAADPLARLDHHALGDDVDAPAVEVDHAGRPQGRQGPADAAAQLLQLHVDRHRRHSGVILGAGQKQTPAQRRARPQRRTRDPSSGSGDEDADQRQQPRRRVPVDERQARRRRRMTTTATTKNTPLGRNSSRQQEQQTQRRSARSPGSDCPCVVRGPWSGSFVNPSPAD